MPTVTVTVSKIGGLHNTLIHRYQLVICRPDGRSYVDGLRSPQLRLYISFVAVFK